MEMTKRVKCESCGGKGMIIPKKHGGMVVPRKCEHCNGTGTIEAQITNADRIRAMSDEELADMCVHYNPETEMYTNDTGEYYFDFVSAMEDELEWLKQPAQEDL